MKTICSPKDCTGCGLCVSECPQKCISMVSIGSLEHLSPHINTNKCNNCGFCKKHCPSINNAKKEKIHAAYAAWSKDEKEYKSSSSGGAASVFSKFIVSKGGVVYGCAILPNIEVKHIRVDRLEDLEKLKGSKYVQSSIIEIFPLCL